MTYAALGGLFLIAIVVMSWRDRRAMFLSVLAILLGVIITKGADSAFEVGANGTLDGLITFLDALANLLK